MTEKYRYRIISILAVCLAVTLFTSFTCIYKHVFSLPPINPRTRVEAADLFIPISLDQKSYKFCANFIYCILLIFVTFFLKKTINFSQKNTTSKLIYCCITCYIFFSFLRANRKPVRLYITEV